MPPRLYSIIHMTDLKLREFSPGFSDGRPPPPPGPGSAPPAPRRPAAQSASATPNRAGLLSDINKGKKLKKAVTNDRSAPLVSGSTTASSGPSAPQLPSSKLAMVPSTGPPEPPAGGPQLGGLFANGMPTLKKNNRPASDVLAAPPTRVVSTPVALRSPAENSRTALPGHRPGKSVGEPSQAFNSGSRAPSVPPPPPPPSTSLPPSNPPPVSQRLPNLGLPPPRPTDSPGNRSRSSSTSELGIAQPPPRPLSNPPSLPNLPPPPLPNTAKTSVQNTARSSSLSQNGHQNQDIIEPGLISSRPLPPAISPARTTSLGGLTSNDVSSSPSHNGVPVRPASPLHQNGSTSAAYSLKPDQVARVGDGKYRFQPLSALPAPRTFTNCPKVFRSGRPGGSSVPLQLASLR